MLPDRSLDLEGDLGTTKLMDDQPTHYTKYQHSTNTITSTIFSTVPHSLSTMTNIKTHSTLNTTIPTTTASQNYARHNTTPTQARITATTNKSTTTHTLKTLCQDTTVIRYPTIHIHITTAMHIPKNISSPKQPLPIKHPQSRQNLKLYLSNI